jgi:deoxyhypusine synthase
MEKKNEKNVEQIKPFGSDDIKRLIQSMENTGFNGKRLAQACKIYEKMIKDKTCTKFFSLAGAMVPVGMQNIIIDFINRGYIDVLVTTGANCTHDVAEALGYPHLQGHCADGDVKDCDLHSMEINRIFDVFMGNNVYESMEKFIQTLDFSGKTTPSEIIEYIGLSLPGENSFLKAAAKKGIPIFVPAFTDCGLAMQIKFNHDKVKLDPMQDLEKMINLACDAKNAGVMIMGGGVPKNFIFQAMQFSENCAQYAVQITTDAWTSAGGLSSASLDEAVSWGKVNEEADRVTVHCDLTIALPIMACYLDADSK